MLRPGLFPGVTLYRHDSESLWRKLVSGLHIPVTHQSPKGKLLVDR